MFQTIFLKYYQVGLHSNFVKLTVEMIFYLLFLDVMQQKWRVLELVWKLFPKCNYSPHAMNIDIIMKALILSHVLIMNCISNMLQVPSTSKWGREFVYVPTPRSVPGDTLKIIARSANTDIDIITDTVESYNIPSGGYILLPCCEYIHWLLICEICFTNRAQCHFSLEFSEILGQNLICYHSPSVLGIPK